MLTNQDIHQAMCIRLEDVFDEMPGPPVYREDIRRAPRRNINLSRTETSLALKNALRYIPPAWHQALAPEFLEELRTRGRIYGYRFRPKGHIRGQAIDTIVDAAPKARPFR